MLKLQSHFRLHNFKIQDLPLRQNEKCSLWTSPNEIIVVYNKIRDKVFPDEIRNKSPKHVSK